MANILLIEDEFNLLKMTQMMLEKAGHCVRAMASGKEAMQAIQTEGKTHHGLPYDVVVTDYCLRDSTGLDVLQTVKAIDESTQVLLVTAYATTQTAVEAMRSGAYDYIEKPFKRDQLLGLIEKAEARRMMMKSPNIPAQSHAKISHVVGDSPEMKAVIALVMQVAPTRASILITGESGTGKEVIAQAIHQNSTVSGGFVAVNCGAIPENLVESEFFGYTKGAFTGANRDKQGFFQAAHGGTLFLDEIGELPLTMQVKLLRAIQEKKVQPVGSTSEIPVNVRIIAATNRDLRAEVDAHRFREDLFFRLNVIQISLPALRERRSDIAPLVHHFLNKLNHELGKNITGVDADAMSVLVSYDYRGNVRELENILEHAATLELGTRISLNALPSYMRQSVRQETRTDTSSEQLPAISAAVRADPDLAQKLENGDTIELEGVVEKLERSLIEQSLEKTDGNKTEAAKLLGISFRSLRYRLKKYGYE